MIVEETNESETRAAAARAPVHVSRKYIRILIDMHARDERGLPTRDRNRPLQQRAKVRHAKRDAAREAGGGRGGGGNAFTTDHPNNSYSIVCADIHKSDVWITYTYNRPIVFFSFFFFRSQTLGDNIGSGVMIRAKADLAELLKYRASSRG